MEWSIKPPYQWDLVPAIFNSEETTSYSHLEPMEWYGQRDPEFNFGSLNLAGDGKCYDSPVSDLLNSSSSKSLKLASLSIIEEFKNSKSKADDFEVFLEDCNRRKEIVKNDSAENSPAIETSAGSSEQLFLSLKLGKGMCYEKAEASLSMMPSLRQNRAKKCKSAHQNSLIPRCQVEDCNIDLSFAKEYHRKHRVCETHSRSPKVIIAGQERRFCQQCSGFHSLSEFDEKKRSCRKRLSDHNARRRKPQPKLASFNPGNMSTVYDPRQKMSLSSDRLPPAYQRARANLEWDALCSSRYTQTCQMKPEKEICKNGQLYSVGIEKPFTITTPTCNSRLNEYRVVSPSMGVPQNLNSALSLLSTDSWGLFQTQKHSNQSSMPSATEIQARTEQSTSEHWSKHNNTSASGYHLFQHQGDGSLDFQLVKSPPEIGRQYPDLLS